MKRDVMKRTIVLAMGLVFAAGSASAQDSARVQKLFEAGRFQQVVESVPPDAAPEALYTAAQSHQKLGSSDQALDIYRQLAGRGDGDPWSLVGLSGQQLLEDNTDAALDSAQRAVDANGD